MYARWVEVKGTPSWAHRQLLGRNIMWVPSFVLGVYWEAAICLPLAFCG